MKIYTKEELDKVLKLHKLWLKDNKAGVKADLRCADLSFADLSSANLRCADLSSADLRYADLRFANLRSADLSCADLSFADLSSADLDYSCFPFHCGGSNFKCSAKLLYQLLAHTYTLIPADKDEEKEFSAIKKAIKKYALKSHRAKDLNIK